MSREFLFEESVTARPFLKWAGGKTQLIDEIRRLLPLWVREQPFTYVEPFVGSGAVLFWMLRNYPSIEKAIINDINEDLVNTYRVIASQPQELIEILEFLQNEYCFLRQGSDEQKAYYGKMRNRFNTKSEDNTTHAALMIFLNKTCFNGLYRVNRHGAFNVPIGSYANPRICDKTNILAVSNALKRVDIMCGDFAETLRDVSTPALVYLDPPYKPLSKTSSFNSYAKESFDDAEQKRLGAFCKQMDKDGFAWILSNSDVYSTGSKNPFFDNLYASFRISRVWAKRSINVNSQQRGSIPELLVTNIAQ